MAINRRKFLRTIAVLSGTAALETAQAQSGPLAPYLVADLSAFAQEWNLAQFPFNGRHAIALRVPPPSNSSRAGLLEVKLGSETGYLRSYHLICTHLGCTPALPNSDHLLICPCHGSSFHAEDASAADGRPNPPLRGIRLELRGTAVYAVGYLS